MADIGKPVPVEKDKEYDVVIDAQGSKGDGIAHIQGFVVFIPNAKMGDKVKIKVTGVMRTFATGEVTGPATAEPAPA